MSKRINFNQGFIPQPSKRDVEAAFKKRREEEEELKKKMNILPRDESKWPMPSKEELSKAGTMLYTMTTLASSYDENLNAVIWQFYVDWMNCVKKDSTKEDLFAMIGSVTRMKEYLAASRNPLFTEPEKKQRGPEKNQEGQENPEGPEISRGGN